MTLDDTECLFKIFQRQTETQEEIVHAHIHNAEVINLLLQTAGELWSM